METIYIKVASSNGRRPRLGRTSLVSIGKFALQNWRTPGGARLTCFLASRTPWQGDEDSIKKIKEKGKMNDEGYVNVASELGLSGRRGMIQLPLTIPEPSHR